VLLRAAACAHGEHILSGTLLGVTVNDLLYIGLTIVVFAVLILLVKGVERFER
jgi:hypothetical protein